MFIALGIELFHLPVIVELNYNVKHTESENILLQCPTAKMIIV